MLSYFPLSFYKLIAEDETSAAAPTDEVFGIVYRSVTMPKTGGSGSLVDSHSISARIGRMTDRGA